MYSYRSTTIQQIRKLIDDKRARDSEHAFVIEGVTFIRDAAAAGAHIRSLVASPRSLGAGKQLDVSAEIIDVDDETMARLSDTKTPAGLLAVIDMPAGSYSAAIPGACSVMVCAGISDPGNAGTLIRSCAAFGFDAVWFTKGSVDPFQPKVVRASASALFSLKVIRDVDGARLASAVESNGLAVYGLAANGKRELPDVTVPERFAIAVGNEAHGLGEWASYCTELLRIPMSGSTESLNAAVAGSLAAFHFRQC